MTTLEKIERIKELGQLRQSRCYPGFFNLSDFENGKYESAYVSPYTKGSGNVDSKIFVMLQDWASRDRILKGLGDEAVTLGYTPSLPTNRNLHQLLYETFGCQIRDVFTTNLFPYVKPGAMDSSIAIRHMRTAFAEFALPQIKIVSPQLVICCGASVYKTAFSHFHLGPFPTFPLNHSFKIEENTITFVYQNHPGTFGTNAAGGIRRVHENWQVMKSIFT